MLGRPDLAPGPMTAFPGFPRGLGSRKVAQPDVVPIVGSTPAGTLDGGADGVKFVIHVGGPYPEYVIVTGEHWFFKTAEPFGPACEFHEWPKARAKGVAAAQPLTGHSETEPPLLPSLSIQFDMLGERSWTTPMPGVISLIGAPFPFMSASERRGTHEAGGPRVSA
jgi:hypothetical protein